MHRITSVACILIGIFFLISGCGGKEQATQPSLTPETALQSTVPGIDSGSSHTLLGEWVITLSGGDSPDNPPSVTCEPIRGTQNYFDVTPLAEMEIIFVSLEQGPGLDWTTWTFNVILTNNSPVTGFDVWGVIYPPEAGAYIPWENQDGLTTLYGGDPLHEFNPFMAYAKEEEQRRFEGSGTSHVVTYVIRRHIDFKFTQMPYKVTACFPGNADSPVGSFVYEQEGPIYPDGSDSLIRVMISDWQDDVSTVQADFSNVGVPGLAEMTKYAEDTDLHVSYWRYHLTQGAGIPVGQRECRLFAYDDNDEEVYGRDFEVTVEWDLDGPTWVDPACIGIYDHISGPMGLRLFFCEAEDFSTPIQYAFHGDSDQSCFDGDTLKVVMGDMYEGFTNFAPESGDLIWYGIRLVDAQGNESFSDECRPAVRYDIEPRWTSPNDMGYIECGIEGGAVLGDVNGDGVDDIVIGGRNGKIYAWEGHGTGTQNVYIWQVDIGSQILGCPALVDLDGDDCLDAVVGAWNSQVYARSGSDGSEMWTASTVPGEIISGTPGIGQFNGGAYDVVIGTGGGRLYALNGEDGSEIWTYDAGGGIGGSLGIVDVTGDTVPEVCFGAFDNSVYMVNGIDGSYMWSHNLGPYYKNVSSGPAMVDLTGDDIPDCVIGAAGEDTGFLYAFEGLSGDPIWTQDQLIGNPLRDPAPCMINDDDIWDFIVTCYSAEVYSYYAIDGATGEIIYTELAEGVEPIGYTDYTSPIVGDFTGDGHLNTMFGIDTGFVPLFNVADFDLPGKQYGMQLANLQVSVGPKLEINGPVVVGDVDDDGELELVVTNQRGYIFVLDLNVPIPDDPNLSTWFQNHGNRWHNGVPNFVCPD